MKVQLYFFFCLLTGFHFQNFLEERYECKNTEECFGKHLKKGFIKELEQKFYLKFKESLANEVLTKIEEIKIELEEKMLIRVSESQKLLEIQFESRYDQKVVEFEKNIKIKIQEEIEERISEQLPEIQKRLEDGFSRATEQSRKSLDESINKERILVQTIIREGLSQRDAEIKNNSENIKKYDESSMLFEREITEKTKKHIGELKRDFDFMISNLSSSVQDVVSKENEAKKKLEAISTEITAISIDLNSIPNSFDKKIIAIEDKLNTFQCRTIKSKICTTFSDFNNAMKGVLYISKDLECNSNEIMNNIKFEACDENGIVSTALCCHHPIN
jgi:methyl-accepting chemotaxis protein